MKTEPETFTELARELADSDLPDAALAASLEAVGLPSDLVDLLRDEIESVKLFGGVP